MVGLYPQQDWLHQPADCFQAVTLPGNKMRTFGDSRKGRSSLRAAAGFVRKTNSDGVPQSPRVRALNSTAKQPIRPKLRVPRTDQTEFAPKRRNFSTFE